MEILNEINTFKRSDGHLFNPPNPPTLCTYQGEIELIADVRLQDNSNLFYCKQ